jgi:hypothetical protein
MNIRLLFSDIEGCGASLTQVQIIEIYIMSLAEREGFEPSIEFPLYTLSRRAPSTTRPSLQFCVAVLSLAQSIQRRTYGRLSPFFRSKA